MIRAAARPLAAVFLTELMGVCRIAVRPFFSCAVKMRTVKGFYRRGLVI